MSWNNLSMRERADVMRLAIENGIYDLDTIRAGYNSFAEGGDIHISPSKKGTFTAAASKHNMGVQEFASKVLANKDDYSTAMVRKANFARNAKSWRHDLGGELIQAAQEGDEYGEGVFDRYKKKPKYRNRPAVERNIKTSTGTQRRLVPARVRHNNSPTAAESEKFENGMRNLMVLYQDKSGGSDPAFDIPYIPEKKIILNSRTTSTNVLDSLAKYAGIHNRDPKLSTHRIRQVSEYGKPRKINMDEMLGLAGNETYFGAEPYFNEKGDQDYLRALGNSNYFTAFDYIPADNLLRNYQYNKASVDRSIPPILDAFRYYAQGDYNRGDPNHTRKINVVGRALWENPLIREWWEKSGQYWYNNPTGKRNEKYYY